MRTASFQQLAAAHADPEKVGAAPHGCRTDSFFGRMPKRVPMYVLRTGNAELYADVTDAVLRANWRSDAEHLELLRARADSIDHSRTAQGARPRDRRAVARRRANRDGATPRRTSYSPSSWRSAPRSRSTMRACSPRRKPRGARSRHRGSDLTSMNEKLSHIERGAHREDAARRAVAIGGGGGESLEGGLSRAHEPRAAHAAQRDRRLLGADGARPARPAHRRAERRSPAHQEVAAPSAEPHQRRAQLREARGGARALRHRAGLGANGACRRSSR